MNPFNILAWFRFSSAAKRLLAYKKGSQIVFSDMLDRKLGILKPFAANTHIGIRKPFLMG